MADIPVFVRAGTVLPWGGEAQYTGELKSLPLDIRLFPGAQAPAICMKTRRTATATSRASGPSPPSGGGTIRPASCGSENGRALIRA